ncbi:hypothetical protein ACFVYA_40885 [Amycolatopsis sp. NPDC058278]|uniref:hypothetical protein n=1 Tax=Amycolatopsis sp. NPDC058278 TaxID=3346417 RepID=UPI0036DEE58C
MHDAACNDTERRAADSAERLRRDLDLFNELERADFTGVGWDLFANELAKYGIAVMVVWMRTHRIFTECARVFSGRLGKKFGLPEPPHDWTDEDRADLSALVVTKALTTFKRQALIGGGWSASRGAGLSTYFIGTCIYEFPNLYTQWLAQRAATLQQGKAEHATGTIGTPPVDPAAAVAQADHADRALARLPDRKTRIVVKLVADGYTQDEIAEALSASGFPSATKDAVRGVWQRHVKRARTDRGVDDD